MITNNVSNISASTTTAVHPHTCLRGQFVDQYTFTDIDEQEEATQDTIIVGDGDCGFFDDDGGGGGGGDADGSGDRVSPWQNGKTTTVTVAAFETQPQPPLLKNGRTMAHSPFDERQVFASLASAFALF